jgi:transposase-like protein
MENSELYNPTWSPPHCPSPNCKYHKGLHSDWPWKRMGFYLRQAQPKRIRRFQCLHCGVTFSSQTFSTTYWLKKPDIVGQLMTKVVGGMCNSQIATDLAVTPATIDRQIYRLGRHCQLFHLEKMKIGPRFRELVVDSFVTFEQSQYHPYHLHLAVDRDSAFIPHFTDSEVRRSGRMTPEQKLKRQAIEEERGRPDPQAVRKDVAELLKVVTANATEVTIHSDEHKAYPRAMRGIPCHIRHIVTHSKEHRDRWNRLYEMNLLDLLIRHAEAEHKRETIAYSKRRNCGIWRLMIFLVWKNYLRSKRVRTCAQTPAMLIGLCERRLTVPEILGRRLFWAQVGLEGRWRQYYWGEVETRALKVNRRHLLKYAA